LEVGKINWNFNVPPFINVPFKKKIFVIIEKFDAKIEEKMGIFQKVHQIHKTHFEI
jgi:hypothetical protein